MTDSTQDTLLRQNAIAETPMPVSVNSVTEVITETQVSVSSNEAIAYGEELINAAKKNKGIITGCLSNLPAPVLAILKSLAHLALIPLHVIARLPMGSIYKSLDDFANGKICQPPAPPPPTLTSDCQ